MSYNKLGAQSISLFLFAIVEWILQTIFAAENLNASAMQEYMSVLSTNGSAAATVEEKLV